MKALNGMSRFLPVLIVVAIAAAAFLVLTGDGDKKYVTASFPRTVSLYECSDVRILGVSVGQVESVEPAGTEVKVKISYGAQYDVPADGTAELVAAAVVGGRLIQLTPVDTGGEKLPDNAVFGLDRTEVPLELDQIYQSIDDLT